MTPSDVPPLDDDQLLSVLREAVTIADPPPADLEERARRAFGWDAAMARLVEVVTATEAVPALRAVDTPVTHRFELDGVEIQLEVEVGADESVALVGIVEPVPSRLVVIDPDGAPADVDVDERGRFVAEVRAAAVVLQVELPDGRRLRTPVVDLDAPDH